MYTKCALSKMTGLASSQNFQSHWFLDWRPLIAYEGRA
jgi:hypothetical protein